jgi:hypothetical protein
VPWLGEFESRPLARQFQTSWTRSTVLTGTARGDGNMSNKVIWAIASAFLTTTSAWAGANYESGLSSCTTINCAGMTIRGVQQVNDPFFIQVFAREGECLRLDVSTQTEDAAMLITATTVGDFLPVDDVAGLRPVAGIDPVPQTGWYTVAVSYFDYSDLLVRFTLEYGRYNTGNPNCSQATEAIPMAPAQLKPAIDRAFKVSSPAADSSKTTDQRD